MAISLAPTFLNIILTLTWMIHALLVVGVVVRVKHVMKQKPSGNVLRDDIWGTEQLKQAMEKFRIAQQQTYRDGVKVLWMRFMPAIVGVAVLNRMAQKYLPQMHPSIARVVLGSLVAVLFALLLFYVKIRGPVIYGTLEGIFAVLSCSFALSKMSNTFSAGVLVGLLTSIYLMIRAMDNIKKGRDQERLEAHSVLTTVERLANHEAVSGFRVYFATIVRATGELFFIQTGLNALDQMIPPMPTLQWDYRYIGVVFHGADAHDLWMVANPSTEDATFRGRELKTIDQSWGKLFNASKRQRLVPGAEIWMPWKETPE